MKISKVKQRVKNKHIAEIITIISAPVGKYLNFPVVSTF